MNNKKRNCAIILAGGKGSRMNANLPKALVEVVGKPMIERVSEAVRAVCGEIVVVIGHEGDKVRDFLGNKVEYAWQKEQLGTGHAVGCVRGANNWNDFDSIVVVPTDHPLISSNTIKSLIEKRESSGAEIVLATILVPCFEGDYKKNFYSFGRIVRNQRGEVNSIIEAKDATKEEIKIKELNAGFYCFKPTWLWSHIDKLKNLNAQKEYYLTDLVKIAKEEGASILAFSPENPKEGLGVNTKEQKEFVEKQLK